MKSNPLNSSHFAAKMLNWYSVHARDLPWRKTLDPYLIWVSEIILQQTRVDQGLPYYYRFTENFPTLASLANSSEKKVLKVWEGLGYYSRARNMLRCAKTIVKEHGGRFPENYHALLKLPGIGKYTGAAIASFSFKENVPAIDGNVIRVLTRLFKISDNPGKLSTFNILFNKSMDLLPQGKSHLYNQAMMELGSQICKPRNPLCHECPVSPFCEGYASESPEIYPFKKRKSKLRKRFFNYVILRSGNMAYMQKREGNDIWKGLYEFLLYESNKGLDHLDLLDRLPEAIAKDSKVVYESKVYKHLLSHQEIRAKFIELELLNNNSVTQNKWKMYNRSSIKNLPKPVLIKNYLEERSI